MASSLKVAIAVLLLVYLYVRLQHGWYLEESREAQMVRLGSKLVASDLLKRGRLWRDVTGGGERPRHNSLTNRPHWFLDSLLLLAGDIELNPGPKEKRDKRLLEEPSSSSKRVKLDVKSSSSKFDEDEVRSSAVPPHSKRRQKLRIQPIIDLPPREEFTPIGSLSLSTDGWTIKARVLSRPYLHEWENDRSKGQVVNFYLADKTGEIKVYAYNELAKSVYSQIKAGSVCLISGGRIQPANQQYTNIELEILLNYTTKRFKVCQDDHEIPSNFNYTFTDINYIMEFEPGSVVDVIGICDKASALQDTRHNTLGHTIKKRDILLRDRSGCVTCTLYESDAKDFDFSNKPVVAIKAGKVTEMSEIDASYYSSAVHINPSIRESKELQGWKQGEDDYMLLYKEALAKETKVRLGIVQCMVVGPPQVGKTKLKNRLVGEDYSADDPSTGVADKPYVVVHTVHANKTNWRPLKFDTEKKLFLQRLSSSMQSTMRVDSVQHRNRDDASDEGISTQFLEKQGSKPPSPQNAGDHGISSSVEDTIPITEDEPSEEPVPYEEFITAVVEDTKQAEALAEKDVEDGCMIYFTDTGGQLEFQEVLPSIISGPAIFMIVFNLNDAISPNGLNKQFEVKYKSREGRLYNRGQEESVPTMSIKELILQTLASIYSTKHASTVSGKEITPKAILVGTHLDQMVKEEGGQLVEDEEAIERVNTELKALLKETDFRKESLLVYPSKNSVFFKVNNEIADHPTFNEIKKKIGSIAQVGQQNSLYVDDVPFSWLAFDIKLRLSKQQLLSISDCIELARSCGIEKKDEIKYVTETMNFLQWRFGFIRCISNLDLVITNPQIIYDSITDLVVESFCENDQGIPKLGDCDMFKEKGLIPVGVLQELHKKDIIPLEKLLKLLDYLNVVVTVEEDEHGEPSMYFMPCVLAHAPRAGNNPQVQPLIAELLVGFRCERCPKGVFSALLANLSKLQVDQNDKSMYKWCLNVCDTFVSLYRDQVSFEIFEPNEESSVRVYVSVSNYIIISIYPQDQEACTMSTVCNNVFRKVRQYMQMVCSSLAYEGHYFGFYCKNRHIAKFRGERPKQMICAKCKKSDSQYKYDLEDKHLHWFERVQSSDLKSRDQSQGSTNSTAQCRLAPYDHSQRSLETDTGISGASSYVSTNRILTDFCSGRGLANPTKDSFSSSWWNIHNLPRVGAKTPIIAILDTGINQCHAAFTCTSFGGCKVITSASYIAGDASVQDTDGHGTACAAIAAGYPFCKADNGVALGGVASEAKLIICRVATSHVNDFHHDPVSAALQALIELNNRHKTVDGIPYVDVVSISFFTDAIPGCDWSDLLSYLRKQGTICVAAAGNSGNREHLKYPAFLGHVISVGSHTDGGKLSDCSRDGADVYALGENVCVPDIRCDKTVLQTVNDITMATGLGTANGTSVAAPAVAGLITRLIEYGHHHFGNDNTKLRWLHNSDMVLNKILKVPPMRDGLILQPRRFFYNFGFNIDEAMGVTK